MMTERRNWFMILLLSAFFLPLSTVGISADPTPDAIYRATGVQGGLVVHVGCGDGRLTAQLRINDRYVVQGLDTNRDNVAAARQRIQSNGAYGKISIDTFDGKHLPYVDNLVNLMILDESSGVSDDEIQRVMAPGGVIYRREGDQWRTITKPLRDDTDEWTHFLHDSGGNAVAQDRQVGPPKGLRWVAGPRWCRSHEVPSSVNAVAVGGGRTFSILDEAPIGVYQNLPWQCRLVARDANSGVLLWKVPLRAWQPELGTGTGNRWNIHHTIPRRLVVSKDRVYVTLQFRDSPVSVLDAATGNVLIEAIEGTRGTDEIVLCDEILVVKTTEDGLIGATERFNRDALHNTLAAVDTRTGRLLWRHEKVRVVPYALSARAGNVVYHNMDELVCLDLKSGEPQWRVACPIASTLGGTTTLVVTDDVVLFHGHGKPAAAYVPGQPNQARASRKSNPPRGPFFTAIALDTGDVLWCRPGNRSLAAACTQPTDVFVIGDTVWCGNSLDGYDLRTGAVKRTLEIGNLISPGHHFRCFRAKATSRFLIWPKRGAEFIDLEGTDHMRNDWLRAPCFTGLTPANGLLYVPPSQCFCYPGVLVSGFLAMTKDPSSDVDVPKAKGRVERGPAWGSSPPMDISASDWPMHRHDVHRSGATAQLVPTQLKERWEVQLPCPSSQAVVVGDRLWIAAKDRHRIECRRLTDGQLIWNFTAGGRIDSAPTIHQGRVLFGCCDGAVYCLRASDGALMWRFLATPLDRRLVAFDQVESVWPVHGSVLVQNDVVYFAAGRSSFLDGGIHVYGLDVRNGEMLCHHKLEGPWPDPMKDVGTPFAMDGFLPDLLVSDGSSLYMRRAKFDTQLNPIATPQESDLGELNMGRKHLVATGGFLDDSGFDRLYWMHSAYWPGFYFSQNAPKAGQMVVFDDRTTYAVKYFYRRVQWSPAFFPGDQGYLLYADDIDNEPVLLDRNSKSQGISWLPSGAYSDKHRRGGRGVEKGTGSVRQKPAKWQKLVPLRIRAMVLAGDHLFAAGPPDVVDPADPLAAFEGRAGARLQVFNTTDGSLVNSYDLPAQPQFDGMSAAQGQLLMTTTDGKLICFGQ